jgi:hypothetical protein
MRRRQFVTTGAVGLAGTVLAAQAALGKDENRADTKRDPQQQRDHDNAFQACAKECSDCQRSCDECGKHCLDKLASGDEHHRHTLATCQDCATVCAAASHIVSRSGPFSADICRACAEVCAQCAEACEKHAHDDTMAACAKACRTCEDACRKMLTAAAGKHDARR